MTAKRIFYSFITFAFVIELLQRNWGAALLCALVWAVVGIRSLFLETMRLQFEIIGLFVSCGRWLTVNEILHDIGKRRFAQAHGREPDPSVPNEHEPDLSTVMNIVYAMHSRGDLQRRQRMPEQKAENIPSPWGPRNGEQAYIRFEYYPTPRGRRKLDKLKRLQARLAPSTS